jgi:hypothetical protein
MKALLKNPYVAIVPASKNNSRKFCEYQSWVRIDKISLKLLRSIILALAPYRKRGHDILSKLFVVNAPVAVYTTLYFLRNS